MYAQAVTAATCTATTLHPTAVHLGLSLLRLQLSTLLNSGTFTPAERQTATARIYATTDAAQLLTWKRNLARLKAEREAAQATAPKEVDTTNIPDAEEVEREAAQMWIEPATTEEEATSKHPLLSRALQNAVEERNRRGRTSDYAGELAYAMRGEAFQLETGLSYSELAAL
ncbi:hypothetical protein [Hymenobacter metallicola]|uniref:Uncharacterized protein n=1 Tax=Hymenobacter metallicola TaxID=2563114 RepID=A0A4Z0Q0H5_9BACT|nr:hypothetical protein [Hymenobacter metallicola]TGE23530.1 hypothetical protein E5K02_20305 [Hymenobacter metallicola]